MKKIFAGIIAMMLMTGIAFAGDNKKPSKKQRAKKECKKADCCDQKCCPKTTCNLSCAGK